MPFALMAISDLVSLVLWLSFFSFAPHFWFVQLHPTKFQLFDAWTLFFTFPLSSNIQLFPNILHCFRQCIRYISLNVIIKQEMIFSFYCHWEGSLTQCSSNLNMYKNHLERLLQHRSPGPTRGSDSTGLAWDLRISVCRRCCCSGGPH